MTGSSSPANITHFAGEKSIQPLASWESPETKRRLHNLLVVSRLFDKLQHIHLHDRHPDVSGHALLALLVPVQEGYRKMLCHTK